MDYDWRPPGEQLTAWMEGQIHHMPPVRKHDLWYAEDRRRRAFFQACRSGDPELVVWPEFEQGLLRLNLKRWYDRGTISVGVVGLLIASDNRSVGDWMARGAWLSRRGKNPLKRRRYVAAMRQFYQAVAVARRMAEQRRFEMIAMRAMEQF